MDGVGEPAEVDEGPIKGVLAFGAVIHGYQYVPASPPLPCLSFQLWLRLWRYRYQSGQRHISPAVLFPILLQRFHLLRLRITKPRERIGYNRTVNKVGVFGFRIRIVFVKYFGGVRESWNGGWAVACASSQAAKGSKHFRVEIASIKFCSFFWLCLLTLFSAGYRIETCSFSVFTVFSWQRPEEASGKVVNKLILVIPVTSQFQINSIFFFWSYIKLSVYNKIYNVNFTKLSWSFTSLRRPSKFKNTIFPFKHLI